MIGSPVSIFAPPDLPADFEAAERRRVAQRREMLAALAEIGMALARAIGRQALAAAEPEGDAAGLAGEGAGGRRVAGADLGLSFARVARAVRQTLALEARLSGGLKGLEGGAGRGRVANAQSVPGMSASAAFLSDGGRAVRRTVNQHVAYEIVEQAIEAETPDDEAAERLFDDLLERLEDEDYDIGEQPIGVSVARICRDLALSPDWTRWAGEAWAVEEAKARERGSPYGRPALKPREPPPDDAAGAHAESSHPPGGRGGKTGPPWN